MGIVGIVGGLWWVNGDMGGVWVKISGDLWGM